MSHPPAPLPSVLTDHFSTSDALALDLTRGRMRSGDLVAPFHGTRRRRAIDDVAEAPGMQDDDPWIRARARRETARNRIFADMRSYATVMPEGSFFCGRTAALKYEVWVEHPRRELEVAMFAPARAPRAKGVKGRRIAAHLATTRTVDGLKLSDPASTWAMLARDLTLRELIVAGDAFIKVPRDGFGNRHPERALATLAELGAAVDAGPRPPRTRRLREAFELLRVGSASHLETEYRLDAAEAGLPEPTLDREMRVAGRLLGVSEVVYEEYGVVVEIEGDQHRTERRQWERDIEKYNAYNEAGWIVVRLTSTSIRGRNANGVSVVRSALRRRGWIG